MKAKAAVSKNSKSSPKIPAIINKDKIITSPRKNRITSTTSRTMQISEKEQLRQVLSMVKAIRSGDFSVRLNLVDETLIGNIAEVLNDINEMNFTMANEFIRVGRIVGKEGKMTERVSVGSVKGAWFTSVESVNTLIGDLVQPTTEAARVITSVAKGDLSQKMTMAIDGTPMKGEFARIGMTVNTMVDQLNSFASEVTRVAKEVGTEGRLGGQAEVKGASGTWKDLTDNVNFMASNLTTQEGVTEVSPESKVEIKPMPLNADFTNNKVLIIDDDMRNIFATTVILERKGIEVIYAENGKLGIQKLQENPDVDMILMDIMMPEMGGIEATQEIRKIEIFKNLPIITLTAKAMKGDREKCLEAGATDYITKPVDPDYLLSIMHKWLFKTPPPVQSLLENHSANQES